MSPRTKGLKDPVICTSKRLLVGKAFQDLRVNSDGHFRVDLSFSFLFSFFSYRKDLHLLLMSWQLGSKEISQISGKRNRQVSSEGRLIGGGWHAAVCLCAIAHMFSLSLYVSFLYFGVFVCFEAESHIFHASLKYAM